MKLALDYYSKAVTNEFMLELTNELNTLKCQINDNKLYRYANLLLAILYVTKELSKIRISAHDLLIELGLYF